MSTPGHRLPRVASSRAALGTRDWTQSSSGREQFMLGAAPRPNLSVRVARKSWSGVRVSECGDDKRRAAALAIMRGKVTMNVAMNKERF